ncbi:hypothetical protein PR048_012760 [Dryococelus australis]|uniref:Uncharacterized protein n=1 Tax=Dryococelus australis TaxID=614101 RepID=A0ABQ9HQB2_9NEOP|nr:hypothetical protein PR048_012760 [Dryococelus australis]
MCRCFEKPKRKKSTRLTKRRRLILVTKRIKKDNIDKTFVSANFDFQIVIQINVSDVGPMYYSRKLYVNNLTVYEAAQPNTAY